MLAYYMLQQWKRQISDSCFYQKLSTALEKAGLPKVARKSLQLMQSVKVLKKMCT